MYKICLAIVALLTFGQCLAADAEIAALLKKTPVKQMIVYRPAETKAVATIFTDLDCSYCHKLHLEIPKLMELGIELHYIAYPRHGIGSASYNTIVSIWCSKDPKEAMTQAMSGVDIKPRTCVNPVEANMLLGRKFGISGTPTVIFEDGTIYGGYLSASRLAKEAIKHTLKE